MIQTLHGLGFALIWIRPNSKAPVNAGWTTGPRDSLEKLAAEYVQGYGLGVRLGTPSAFADGTYLACLDIDVKSADARHQAEAYEAARKVFALESSAAIVITGRGFGSAHVYFRTRTPFKTITPARSKESVTYHSPSKQASKYELQQLGEKACAEGLRIGPAWEVALYSDGRQCVLPGSIHPDTKQPYVWFREQMPATPDAFPIIDLNLEQFSPAPAETRAATPSTAIRSGAALDTSYDYDELVTLDDFPRLSKKAREAIEKGTDVTDRSASLLGASMSLLNAGATPEQIAGILSDEDYFLGQTAYEHAKTTDRDRAVAWLYKYTLEKAAAEYEAREAYIRDAKRILTPVNGVENLTTEDAVKRSEFLQQAHVNGFYTRGPRGALQPDYPALLAAFLDQGYFVTLADSEDVMQFNGRYYELRKDIQIKSFAELRFDPPPTEQFRVEFLRKVEANHVISREAFLASAEGKINFSNGVLDIASKRFGEHSHKYAFQAMLPFSYVPEAKCPIFSRWIIDTLGDESLVRIVQEFMGYIVRGGEYKYHKSLWLAGDGRNGKSTLIDVMKALLAGTYATIQIKSIVNDKFAAVGLDGKLANFSEETGPGDLSDSGPFKNLTGDGEISAQKKFGDIYQFRNRAKLIMTYNEIPDLKDASHGMLSRPIIIPFRKQITEANMDRGIKAKLLTELPGIFNWALEGWERLDAQSGFTESALSRDAIQQLAGESCPVFVWAENYTKPTNDASKVLRAIDAHAHYRARTSYPFGIQKFARRLKRHPRFGEGGRDMSGRYYVGSELIF